MPSARVWGENKLFRWENVSFIRKKKTELCGQISTVDKGDIRPFECTEQQPNEKQFKVLLSLKCL